MTVAPNLRDPAVILDPHATYHELRATDPVHWSPGLRRWVLTRHADICEVLKDPRVSALGAEPDLEGLDDETVRKIEEIQHHFSTMMLWMDPPDHTRLKGLVHKAFTPRVVERLRDHVLEVVDRLLDAVEPTGRLEVISDLAYQLPGTIISELIGLPPEDRHQFKAWSDQLAAYKGGAGNTDAAHAALIALTQYFPTILEQHRQQPMDDLLSRLIEVEEQGDALSEQELLGTCLMMLFGGIETTMNLIGNGLYLLVTHPEQLSALRADPGLMDAATEEFLRYESPVQGTSRTLLEDIELGGVRVKAGDLVYCRFGAGNRDPAVFADPDRLDIRRQRNPHLAFGYGTHFCLGAPLARLEGRVAIQRVIERYPELRLAEAGATWRENFLIRGFERLELLTR